MDGGTKLKSAIADKDRYKTFIYSDERRCLDTLIELEDRRDDNSQQRSQTTITIPKEDSDRESFYIGGQEFLRSVIQTNEEPDSKIDDKAPEAREEEDADRKSVSTGGPDDKFPEAALSSLPQEDTSVTIASLWKSRHPSACANNNSSKILQIDHRTIKSVDSGEIIEKGRQDPIGLLVSFSCFMGSTDFPNEEKSEGVIEEEILNENFHSSYASKIDFSILGTPADDISANMYVLNPTLMDTLRSHFPYAVQYKNFWLKYSLSQHVSYKNN